MIKYLSYIYDLREKGMYATRTSLRLYFRVNSNDLAKMLAPAYREKLINYDWTTDNIKLTRKGEEYVENYRYGKTDDGDNQ